MTAGTFGGFLARREFALDALIDLFAMHRHVFRCIDTDADLVALDAEYRDGHLVSDHQRLADPASQNKHVALLNTFCRSDGFACATAFTLRMRSRGPSGSLPRYPSPVLCTPTRRSRCA